MSATVTLASRLRHDGDSCRTSAPSIQSICHEAADLIEQQAAEIALLHEYADHRQGCRAWNQIPSTIFPCSCGYTEVVDL